MKERFMNVPLKPIALAMLVATAQLAGAASAQAPGVQTVWPAADGLQGTAAWIGGEAKAGASAAVADARALDDKLAAGGAWTRDELARGFESLGKGIDALGQKIGTAGKASPFGVGA
jgi:hypothetical protein